MNTKRLYNVLLPWGLGEGDYSTNVWAKDPDAAIKMAAEEMAGEKDFETEKERRDWVRGRVANAEPYACDDVEARVDANVRELLAGPRGDRKDTAHVHEVIMNLLRMYTKSKP